MIPFAVVILQELANGIAQRSFDLTMEIFEFGRDLAAKSVLTCFSRLILQLEK